MSMVEDYFHSVAYNYIVFHLLIHCLAMFLRQRLFKYKRMQNEITTLNFVSFFFFNLWFLPEDCLIPGEPITQRCS